VEAGFVISATSIGGRGVKPAKIDLPARVTDFSGDECAIASESTPTAFNKICQFVELAALALMASVWASPELGRAWPIRSPASGGCTTQRLNSSDEP
jgi:hypothetical protein